MRASILACVVILGVHQHACAKEIDVSARALTEWTGAGRLPVPAAANRGFTLPAAGRISRIFPTNEVSLRLVTSPVFGVHAEDWPIIEIGSAALAFVRSGEEGRVVLLAGQAEPETLPYAVKLDADGRSIEPVELEFGVRGNAVSVVHAGETVRVSVEPAPALEVAVSGGASESWVFSQLTVRTPDKAVAANPTLQAAGPKAPNGGSEAVLRTQESSGSRITANSGLFDASGASVKPSSPSNLPAAHVSSLEVFTPPSVRQRISDHISETTSKTNR